jgi:hypothetical protein
MATASGDDELARLRARVRELESLVAKLEAIVAANDSRVNQVRELFALNDLRFAALEREIVELVAVDPEGVAQDPRRLCTLLLRLADESGLLAAPLAGGTRELLLEPAATATLSSYFGVESPSRKIDGIEVPVISEQAHLKFSLELPKMPAGWLGLPLSLGVDWEMQSNSDGRAWMSLNVEDTIHGPPSGSLTSVSWRVQWNDDGAYFTRLPVRGGEEDTAGGPHDYAAERRIFDELFEKLRARARG